MWSRSLPWNNLCSLGWHLSVAHHTFSVVTHQKLLCMLGTLHPWGSSKAWGSPVLLLGLCWGTRHWENQIRLCICIYATWFLYITHVPKPGEQDQNHDQEECLKIPPIIIAFEDATFLCSTKNLCSLGWERYCKPYHLERLLWASSSCGFHPLWHQWLSEAGCDIAPAASTPTLSPSPHLPPSCSMPSSGGGGSHLPEKDLPHRDQLCPFPAVATAPQASCPPSLPPAGSPSTSLEAALSLSPGTTTALPSLLLITIPWFCSWFTAAAAKLLH